MSRIEDHALIGDRRSAALVCDDGTIDWLCLPRFDSPAVFAALLGTRDNGHWRIAPAGPVTRVSRQYRGDTMVLETLFETPDGTVALIDFMTLEHATLVRIVEGRRGAVPCRLDLVLRFNYGATVPWVSRLSTGHGIRAVSGPDQITIRSDVKLRGEGLTTVADFTVRDGERVRFTLSHAASRGSHSRSIDPDTAQVETETHWREWIGRSTYRGRWRAQVDRSLLTLKALTHQASGGIAAAATTSLPDSSAASATGITGSAGCATQASRCWR